MGINKINNQDLPQSTTPPATTTPSVSLSGGTFGVIEATVTKSGGGSYTNPKKPKIGKKMLKKFEV